MATAKASAVPAIARGETVEHVLYRGTTGPKTRSELRRALAPALAGWIEATCCWDEDAALSDHRFVVFSIDVAPRISSRDDANRIASG